MFSSYYNCYAKKKKCEIGGNRIEREKIISEAKQEADQIREQAKRDAEIIASENNNKMEEIKKN